MKYLDYKKVINILLDFSDSLYEENFIFKSGKILIFQNGKEIKKAKSSRALSKASIKYPIIIPFYFFIF